MFAWLFRLFTRRNDPRLFVYHDGHRWRRADPMRLYRALAAHATYRPDVTPVMADAGDAEALATMLQAAQDVFGVRPFDETTGRGLTENEQLDLMIDFAAWLESKKKSMPTSPTSSVTTAASTSPGSPQTSNSDCGSMPTVSGADASP